MPICLRLVLPRLWPRVDIGVFALDASGRVVFVNPAGKSLLGAGLVLTNDRLLIGAAPGGKLKTAIEQMIRATPEDIAADRKPILIYRQKSERPLAIYVLPIQLSSHPAAQFLINTRAIVLAIDPDARGTADPALVRDVLGLTLGEARLAALVASGVARARRRNSSVSLRRMLAPCLSRSLEDRRITTGRTCIAVGRMGT